MGSCYSCTSLMHHENRYQRARTRSRAHTADLDGDDGFPQPIAVDVKYTFGQGPEGVLEEGATGRVVGGFEKTNTTNEVAIKIMPKSSDHGNATAQSLFENEVTILTRIKHKNIVRLIDVAHDENNYYIILSLAKGGDLVEYLFDDSIDITEDQAAQWVRTMLETLEYLHSQNIAHCDLKPENIVFQSNRGGNDILLIDFGLAKIVNDETIYSDLCANRFYTAPEIAQHYLNINTAKALTGKIWKSTDVWAVGVMSYIMVLKTLPFFARTDKGTFESIVNDKLKLPRKNSERYSISMNFRDFIKKILHKNPHKRMTIHQALQHPWIVSNAPSDRDVSASPVDEYGSLENSDNSDHCGMIQSTLLKYLVRGYIRNLSCIAHHKKIEHKKKLTVLDGNLYFNCAIKPSHALLCTNIINTIYDILFNFNDNGMVIDGRTHTVCLA
eukprot:287939_1